MKVVLSRKGFDTEYGGMPSPILPDGTLLSLPIPSKEDSIKYTQLKYGNKDLFTIIKELSPKNKIEEKYTCHQDPDIRDYKMVENWTPLFGQQGAALGHLINKRISREDVFLFFGSFRQTYEEDNVLSFVPCAPIQHIIFGYFQVADCCFQTDGFPEAFHHHPHCKSCYNNRNAIYSAMDVLSFNPIYKGTNTLKYDEKLVLTKKGYSKSRWELPTFFKDIDISYHSEKSHRDDYFQSASKGQEFVFDADENVMNWVNDIISVGCR